MREITREQARYQDWTWDVLIHGCCLAEKVNPKWLFTWDVVEKMVDELQLTQYAMDYTWEGKY